MAAAPMIPFHPLFHNPHLQTIASHYWKRPRALQPIERRIVETEPGIGVLVESQRPEAAADEIVMVHGLEGSGEAGYIESLAAAALRAGFAVHRFHMRTCGGTERLSRTLYHAGLTSDLAAVLRVFRQEGRSPAFVVGFSLGGNVVLKLAGELGDSAADLMHGVCGVSVPLDLGACARRIAAPDNRLYHRRFVRKMRRRLLSTGRYQAADLAGLNSIIAIDDRITAPSFGLGTADNYYRTQSAIGYVERIRVPTLLIQAKDDTFVPWRILEHPAVRGNPSIQIVLTEHGGHLGFLAGGERRFWLDAAILDWIREQ
ncbi:MAG: alpha/beta fold hydrolase [Bryobacteraceae bacterium]